MSRTLATLAMVTINWAAPGQQRDLVDCFVPFIATLVCRRRYSTVDAAAICADFTAEFGLAIPYHPMLTILTRAMKAGFIQRRRGGSYVALPEKAQAADFTVKASEQEAKYRDVLNAFIEYCKVTYDQTLEATQAEATFISFLKSHDLDILFLSRDLATLLPRVSTSPSDAYLFGSFAQHAHSSAPDIFTRLVDISVGHIVANSLVLRDISSGYCHLSDCSFYLDAGLLFSLTGINGEQMANACTDLLRLVSGNKGKLRLFRHTYDEFMGILEGARPWVDSPYYDPTLASRATMFFHDAGFAATDVDLFMLRVPEQLADLQIEVVDAPDPMLDRQFQIDEQALTDTIVSTYRAKDPEFDEHEKEYTVQRDVRSISAIYKLRKGKRPATVRDAAHVLVTTNSTLALASRQFERAQGELGFCIPAALTDVFVGTLVWLQTPMEASRISERRLIADCYAALQPTAAMVGKLTEAADRLRCKGAISDDEAILLKQTSAARSLLQEATLGDPDRFVERTAFDILQEMKASMRQEERAKYNEDRARDKAREEEAATQAQVERQAREAAEQDASSVRGQLARTQEDLDRLTGCAVRALLVVYYIVALAALGLGIAAQTRPQLFGGHVVLARIAFWTGISTTALGAVFGFSVWQTGNRLNTWLRKGIERIIHRAR